VVPPKFQEVKLLLKVW